MDLSNFKERAPKIRVGSHDAGGSSSTLQYFVQTALVTQT